MSIDLDEIQIIDIINSKQHFDFFFSELRGLLKDSKEDKRINNYFFSEEKLKDYHCFHVGFKDNRVLAFSGLYAGPWKSKGWARALTRTYYSKALRKQNLSGHKLPGFATRYMLPLQVSVAKSINLEGIFVSMENSSKKQYFQKIFDSVNNYYSDQNWLVKKDLFNTCRLLPNGKLNNDKSCWQNIAMLKLNEEAIFPLTSKPH